MIDLAILDFVVGRNVHFPKMVIMEFCWIGWVVNIAHRKIELILLLGSELFWKENFDSETRLNDKSMIKIY